MAEAHFVVEGAQLETGTPTKGVVTVNRERSLFKVRAFRSRKSYEMPLARVAEMVVSRMIKQELLDNEQISVPRPRRGRR